MHKKTSAPLVPWPRHYYLSKPVGGGGGLRGVAYKDQARPPPPRARPRQFMGLTGGAEALRNAVGGGAALPRTHPQAP